MTKEELSEVIAAVIERVRNEQDALEARVANDPNRWTWWLIGAIGLLPVAFLAGWFLRAAA